MVHNMTDKQGESFTRVVLKKAGRAKERLMQNFGKADRTTDELFELYESNFTKQQNSATRLQKEIKNYVTCIRSMQAASKNLMDCLTDIYEPEWPGHEQLPLKSHNLELLWEELCLKLNNQVTIPLSTYLCQFSEIKAKIDKRGRKLVDYDGTRHALESVQNNSKKKDEIKLAKLREEMEGARRLYDVLNKELHEELPALYDSRIPFLISILQTMFACQSAFHGQLSRQQAQLNAIVDELAMEAQKGTFHINARLAAGLYQHQQHMQPQLTNALGSSNALRSLDMGSPHYSNKPKTGVYGQPLNASGALDSTGMNVDGSSSRLSSDGEKNGVANGVKSSNGNTSSSPEEEEPKAYREVPVDVPGVEHEPVPTITEPNEEKQTRTTDERPKSHEIPTTATTKDLPNDVLYRVRATYKYEAEDADELNFEAGEIIQVIEYSDPQEQEEGWLMGMKQTTGEKGMFPANFTRPI